MHRITWLPLSVHQPECPTSWLYNIAREWSDWFLFGNTQHSIYDWSRRNRSEPHYKVGLIYGFVHWSGRSDSSLILCSQYRADQWLYSLWNLSEIRSSENSYGWWPNIQLGIRWPSYWKIHVSTKFSKDRSLRTYKRIWTRHNLQYGGLIKFGGFSKFGKARLENTMPYNAERTVLKW